MARRYYESELVRAAEIQPGAELVQRRTVVSVWRTDRQVILTYDDGTSQTYDLATDPAVEVVTAGLR